MKTERSISKKLTTKIRSTKQKKIVLVLFLFFFDFFFGFANLVIEADRKVNVLKKKNNKRL